MNRRRFLAAAPAGCLPLNLRSADSPRRWASGNQRVSLLELYTSEGCSSCPPADDWFSGLQDDERLWSAFIPIAFHVDYWDHLGWKDPFADPEFTLRQRRYATFWRADTIYTPELVLNGREWRRSRTSRPELPAPSEAPALVVTTPGTHRYNVDFASTAPLTFHLALLGMKETSRVTRGENAGRTLTHDFVVLRHQHLNAKGHATLDVSHPPPGAKAIAVWVSGTGDPTPLQATGGWL